MKDIKIIRTCDDFGLHFSINRSILNECHNKKINLVSCIVNNIHEFNTDFYELRNTKILKALHLNATEGKALSTQNKFWVLKTNEFRFGYKTLFLLSILIPKSTQKFLLKEFNAQIETFIDYFEPKVILINSHNHILSLSASRKSLNKLIGNRRVLIRGKKCYDTRFNQILAGNRHRFKRKLYNYLNKISGFQQSQYCDQIIQIEWEWKLAFELVSEIGAHLEEIESQSSNLETIFHLGIDNKNCSDTTSRKFKKLRYLSYYNHSARKVEKSLLNVLSQAPEIGREFGKK